MLLIINNLSLLIVGIAVAGSFLLGFVIYLNNPKSITNKTFFLFSISAGLLGILNYLGYQFQSFFNEVILLWIIRFIFSLVVVLFFSFFLFIYVFPEEKKKMATSIRYILIPLVVFTVLLSLTNIVISSLKIVSIENIKINLGMGIIIHSIVVIYLIIIGIVTLVRKHIKFVGIDKIKTRLLLIGTGIMFVLIMIFNFIFPVFLQNSTFIQISALFIFPFIILTSYSILKHKLFNIKAVRAGVLVFLLVIVSFSEIIFADNLSLILYRITIFFLILIFGIMLIKSVLKEVKMREELQKLYGDLKLADEKLKKLDEEKSEFLSIASHQLRAPMSIIKGYISMIFEGSFGDFSGKLKEILNRIYISNERLVKLVDDLLDISRIERGKMIFSFKRQSFEKIIRDVVQELKPLAEQKDIKIIWEPEDKNFPDVLIDESYMRQVILNLIDNAIKYSNEGEITVNLEAKENSLLFSVKDNGIGISKAIMPFLFQRYSRDERVYTKSAEGMGLGLYVAKKIIEGHDGKIWAESKGEGKGATFFVELTVIK